MRSAISSYGCPHCGKSNPIDARFCAYCGTELAQLDLDALPEPPPRQTEESGAPEQNEPGDAPQAQELADGYDERPVPDRPRAGARRTPPDGAESHRPGPPPPRKPAPPTAESRSIDGLIAPLDQEEMEHLLALQTDGGEGLRLPREQERRLRQMMSGEIPLAEPLLAPGAATHGGPPGNALILRRWIAGLLLGVLVLALALSENPAATTHIWPGVAEAYAVIDELPRQSVVLVEWAYDPATAGEMDLVAQPVFEHLLEQNAQLVVVSQLPTGPASARRLLERASAQLTTNERLQILDRNVIEAGFLPGGPAALALLGQDPNLGLPTDLGGDPLLNRSALNVLSSGQADLAVVVSDRVEPVQRWLEQVQPLNRLPTLAVVSAAADPPLRPYMDSGQLDGLVSGYSGAIGYRTLLPRPDDADDQDRLLRLISGQNWAALVLLLVLVLGNLSLYVDRSAPQARSAPDLQKKDESQ